jgi:hypothetical protein
MGLPSEVIKELSKYAVKWGFNEDDFANLKALSDVNTIFCGWSLLYFLANDPAIPDPRKRFLISSLQKEGAVLPVSEAVEIEGTLKIRRSTTDPNELVGYIELYLDSTLVPLELLRLPIRTFFDAAVERESAPWINYLIDNKYIPIPDYAPPIHPEFHKGFWIRTLPHRKIDEEISVLKKRAPFPSTSLGGHKTLPPSHATDNYTRYSPATFISPTYKIELFSKSDKTGVFIFPRSRTIDYWYSGLFSEELTKEMNFNVDVLDAYKLRDGHHFVNITEAEIHVQYSDCVRNRRNHSRQYDKYGVLEHSFKLNWNEGLFRYKAKHIFGVYVDPDNRASIEAAKELRNKLNTEFSLDLPYLTYLPDERKIQKIAPDVLEQQLKKVSSAAVPHHSTGNLAKVH